MITKIIDDWTGKLTRDNIEEMNSGKALYSSTFGNDPFSNPNTLTWLETATRIDPTGAVITDLIVAQATRLENGITYSYAIGHTGRLYKIQVNDPTTYNPNYDNPVLLSTLTINSPTFKFGSSINFFGATERIYIGHDLGFTRIDTSGANETFIGVLGSYTANVPRPAVQFGGMLYGGNGTNLVQIDTSPIVITYAKFTTAFPVGSQVRDLDVSPDGNYLQIIVSRIPQSDITSTTQDTTSLSSSQSFRYLWNGADQVPSSYESYNSYSINANISFGSHSYTMGYDLGGGAVYTDGTKILTLANAISPTPNSLFSTGNLLGFATPENSSNAMKGEVMFYGQYDKEIPLGLFRLLRLTAGSPQTDVIQIPSCSIVSNLFYGSSSAGYVGNQVGSAKLYFSTLETSSAPTTAYKFYKFTTVPTGTGTAIGGVYETQGMSSFRLFRSILKKGFYCQEVRFYTEPLVANNSFQIDLIGANGNPISGTTKVFTVGGNISAGVEYVAYNPQMAPVHVLGLRITNLGTANWVGFKCELDIEEAGK